MLTLPRFTSRFLAAIRTLRPDPERVRHVLVPMRQAGVPVDHDTALQYSAVWRAVGYISQTVACLPWEVIRETGEKTVKLPNHPVWYLLHTRPNDELSSFAWRETMLAWALTWGNGYSEIEFDEAGRPRALWPISPDRVTVKRDRETGEIFYRVSNYTGGTTDLMAEQVYHLHGLGYDGLQGYSVISLAARSIGISMAAETYGADFFSNGLVSTGGMKHPGKLSDPAYKRLKEQVDNKAMFGQKWRPMILEEGMEWFPIALPNSDAQMLETRQFQISDIARWFGLPPHKLADLSRSTYSNIESQSIEVVNDCFMPWVIRFEQEADYKLFSGRERGIRTKLNVRGLLRGDNASRAAYYQIMRNIGVYSTNDILKLEDMDPIGPEGDERLVQLNQTTLKKLVEGDVPEPQPRQASYQADPAQIEQSYSLLIEDCFRRILAREGHRYEQSAHKLAEKNGFQEWLDSLLVQQRDYMRTTLNPVVMSMAMLCLPSRESMASLPAVLDAAADSHTERTRRALESMRTGQKTAYEIENRAKTEAKELMERIFASILTENSHALSS